MSVLVTGGTGFVGRFIVEHLIGRRLRRRSRRTNAAACRHLLAAGAVPSARPRPRRTGPGHAFRHHSPRPRRLRPPSRPLSRRRGRRAGALQEAQSRWQRRAVPRGAGGRREKLRLPLLARRLRRPGDRRGSRRAHLAAAGHALWRGQARGGEGPRGHGLARPFRSPACGSRVSTDRRLRPAPTNGRPLRGLSRRQADNTALRHRGPRRGCRARRRADARGRSVRWPANRQRLRSAGRPA